MNKLSVLFKFIRDMIRANPFLAILLLVVLSAQGIIPYLIYTSIVNIVNTYSEIKTVELLPLMFIMASLVLNSFFSILGYNLQTYVSDRLILTLTENLIDRVSADNYMDKYLIAENSAKLKTLQQGASSKPINAIVTLSYVIKDGVFIVSSLAIIAKISVLLPIFIIAALIPFTRALAKLQEKNWEMSFGRSKESSYLNYLSEVGIQSQYQAENKIFKGYELIKSKYRDCSTTLSNLLLRKRIAHLLRASLSVITFLLFTSAFYYVLYLYANKSTASVAEVVIAIQVSITLIDRMLDFSQFTGWLVGHLSYLQTYYEFIKSAKKEKNISAAKECPFKKLDIVGLDFSYPGNNAFSLQAISLSIERGDRIAIIGQNGSGKSTLLSLLTGLYEDYTGEILCNGISIKEDIEGWRKKVTIVRQDYCKLEFPLSDSIAFSLNKDDGKLTSAIDFAELDSTIPPNVVLGKDHGSFQPSIGQWQRIALARSSYHDREILVFDEPTSAIDPITEDLLLSKLLSIDSEKTLILVTHKLSSVKYMDKIYLMEDGRIVACGSHADLLERSSDYKKMFLSQAKHYA